MAKSPITTIRRNIRLASSNKSTAYAPRRANDVKGLAPSPSNPQSHIAEPRPPWQKPAGGERNEGEGAPLDRPIHGPPGQRRRIQAPVRPVHGIRPQQGHGHARVRRVPQRRPVGGRGPRALPRLFTIALISLEVGRPPYLGRTLDRPTRMTWDRGCQRYSDKVVE